MRRRWSVRTHLYTLAAVAAVPLAALLVGKALFGHGRDYAEARERVRLLAELTARQLDGDLASIRDTVDYLAEQKAVRNREREECQVLFDVLLAQHPEFRDVVLADAAGHPLHASRRRGEPPADAPAGLVLRRAADGGPELVVAATVTGADGTRGGRIVVPLDLAAFSTAVLVPVGDAIERGLVQADGTVVLASGERRRGIGGPFGDTGEVAALRAALAADGPAVFETDGFVCAVAPCGTVPAAAYARRELAPLRADARARLAMQLAAITAGLLALALVVRRVAHRMLEPLAALTAAAAGRRPEPVGEAGPAEVAELAAAFNRMRADAELRAEALRRNEAYFRAIFDDGGGAVIITGPERFVEVANERACRLLGYTRRELARLTWLDLAHPDDRAAGEERWGRLQRGQLDAYDVDKRFLRKDGTVLHVLVAVNCVRDAQGRIERLVAHLTDLTDRQRAEARLRESERRLELALRGGDLGWWDYDLQTGRAVANDRYRELLGLAPGEYEERPQRWLELVHPADRAACSRTFAAHVAGTTEFYEAEHRMVRPDGTLWWVYDRGCATARDAAGRALRIAGTIRDVTVRKRAELALAGEKQRFEDLVHSIDGIVWEQEAATDRFTFVSRRAEEILGYAVSRWREEPDFWLEHLHPDDRRWVPPLRLAESAGRNEREFLYRMIAADGRAVWLQETLSATVDVAGRPVLRRGVMLDVTSRRLAEERLGAVVRALPDLVFLFDEAGVFLECFTGAPELLMVPREQLLGRGFREFLPPPLAEQVDAAFAELRRSAELVGLSYEIDVAGRRRNFEARFVACEGDRVLAIVRDVTSQAVAEAALRESEARYRLVVEQTGQMVYDVDLATGRIRWYGAAAVREITGWTLEEFPAADLAGCDALIHPDDRAASGAEFDRCRAAAAPFRVEYRFRRADGGYRTVEDLGVFVTDATGRAVRMYGRMSDVTEARRAREERERFNRKLQETQKLESLGVLAGGIAHDFNNLLTGVLGNASLLRLQLPAGSEQLESVEDIEKAAQAAADLCKQMLAYSGKGRLSVQRLHLARLVQNCAALLQISVSKRAHLRFHLDAAVPAIEADATQLRQILMNFVINASEAIGAREGAIDVTVGVLAADRAYLAESRLAEELPPGRYVFLEVADNGSGMAPATLERIFDPFFTTKFTGRGLGLAAVLGIVRGHRGAIRVHSREGEGTTFRVLFPEAGGEEPPVAAVAEPAPLPALSGTVLLADDEVPVRKTAQRLLVNLGFDVVTTVDGVEAVELFQAAPQRYRLVLLDLTMPSMDGRETCRLIREHRPDVPVIFMSGFNTQDAAELFGRETGAVFLQKPFSNETLSDAVRAVLGLGRR